MLTFCAHRDFTRLFVYLLARSSVCLLIPSPKWPWVLPCSHACLSVRLSYLPAYWPLGHWSAPHCTGTVTNIVHKNNRWPEPGMDGIGTGKIRNATDGFTRSAWYSRQFAYWAQIFFHLNSIRPAWRYQLDRFAKLSLFYTAAYTLDNMCSLACAEAHGCLCIFVSAFDGVNGHTSACRFCGTCAIHRTKFHHHQKRHLL